MSTAAPSARSAAKQDVTALHSYRMRHSYQACATYTENVTDYDENAAELARLQDAADATECILLDRMAAELARLQDADDAAELDRMSADLDRLAAKLARRPDAEVAVK